MKRIRTVVVCSALILSLTACGVEKNNSANNSSMKTNQKIEQQEEIPTTTEPTPTENRSAYNSKEVSNKIKNYISDDIDAGAQIVLQSYGVSTIWDTYEAIEKKDLNLSSNMWVMPQFQICQDEKSINIGMYLKGKDMAENAIQKVTIICEEEKFSVNSTHINCNTSWLNGTSGYGFVDFITIDKKEDINYTENLDVFDRMLNSGKKIKLQVKFKKGNKKYTLSDYHVKTFQSMVKYFKEALTYQG